MGFSGFSKRDDGPRHGTADARFGFGVSVHDSSAHTRDSRVVSYSAMVHRAASLQIHWVELLLEAGQRQKTINFQLNSTRVGTHLPLFVQG